MSCNPLMTLNGGLTSCGGVISCTNWGGNMVWACWRASYFCLISSEVKILVWLGFWISWRWRFNHRKTTKHPCFFCFFFFPNYLGRVAAGKQNSIGHRQASMYRGDIWGKTREILERASMCSKNPIEYSKRKDDPNIECPANLTEMVQKATSHLKLTTLKSCIVCT